MTEAEKLDAVALCRKTRGIEAAQRLWIALGLPVVPEMYREMQRRRKPN